MHFVFKARSPLEMHLAIVLFGAMTAVPLSSVAQSFDKIFVSSSNEVVLPNAPTPHTIDVQPKGPDARPEADKQSTLIALPRQILRDEVHVITSPDRLRSHDLIWLLPVAGATAGNLAADTRTMRDVVSHDPCFNS